MEESLMSYINTLIENQRVIEELRNNKKIMEMKNLLITDKLSRMEPNEDFVQKIDSIIENTSIGMNIDNLGKFQILRLIIMSYENAIIPCDGLVPFHKIMPVDNQSLLNYGHKGLEEIADVIDIGVDEIIRYLDLYDSPVKKRNKLAVLLYLKWKYPRNKILKILNVERNRLEEMVRTDLPELYMNIAKMKGIKR